MVQIIYITALWGNYKVNSFLGAVFLDKPPCRAVREYPWPENEQLNNLSSISGLYIYTEPAPNGYGVPGPKVAESVLRAYGFNRKPEELRFKKFGQYLVNWACWDTDDEYPFEGTTGNWHPGEANRMYVEMLKKNFELIRTTANRTIERFLITNSDILTKGRQTWDPIRMRSVPSPTAYQEMAEFFKQNIGKDASNCLEWVQMFFLAMNQTELTTTTREVVLETKMVYNPRMKMRTRKGKRRISTKKITVSGNKAVREHMFDLSRSFCAYIKHGERAKLNRRAIASPNVIKRMLFKIIEQFHLDVGRDLRGSTISIGGEEKKIITDLSSAATTSSEAFKIQATQDASKWNECLSPETFLMMHRTFFDPEIRTLHKLPPPTDHETLFLRLCEASHWILANKMIWMGEGPIAESESSYNRLRWDPTHLGRMNQMTAEWFTNCIPHMYQENYLIASPGMLMGMHNAASTTLALAAVGHHLPPGTAMTTLRSSDDSMTVFVSNEAIGIGRLIELDRKTLKSLGVNLSLEKTLFFDYQFGKYTSWFQDGAFVAQFGVETSALRPQGKNPHDDFHSIANGIRCISSFPQ